MLAEQRPQRALWLPVFFGIGIGVYFFLKVEPTRAQLLVLAALGLPGLILGFNARFGIMVFAAMVMLGYAHAGARSRVIAAPVLSFNYWGAVEGRVIGLDRSNANAPRVLLDQVYLPSVSAARTPARVRISLHGYIAAGVLVPGARITAQARLSPPGAPVEPGGFDFRRMAWFDRLGAVGYVRSPALPVAEPEGGGFRIWLFALRMRISDHVRAQIPAGTGAFATAILTGDRSSLDPAQMTDLRASNLAHLLAISGLHMGLLTGFVFAVFRYGLALIPRAALHLPLKKIAAVAALVAGLAYLMLSGANVATQRAFIMTAVVLVAVILDRPAFTLRAVGIAAMLVLLKAPESLTEAGFQMSFAATTALIAGFNALRQMQWWRAIGHGRWRFIHPVLMLVVTSSLAGAATAPYSAFHFNQVSQFGLLANLLAVPMMGLAVMPAAVVAFCLTPFGLDGPAYWVMGAGINWILAVAHWVAMMPGNLSFPKAGPPLVLPLISLGALFVILWQGRTRVLGVVPILIAFTLWSQAIRPELLVSDDGRLFGLATAEGRALNVGKGHGFEADSWLEDDGDATPQIDAGARPALTRSRARTEGVFASGARLVWLNSPEPLPGECNSDTVLIAPKWEVAPAGPCLFIGREALDKLGAFAISYEGGAPILSGAREAQGQRPWTVPKFQFQ